MKKKTALTKMHIAPSTVCYDAVAARDSNEVGLILAAVRKKNGYSLVAFSELLYNYGVDVSDKGISKWEKGYTTPSIYQLVAICHARKHPEGAALAPSRSLWRYLSWLWDPSSWRRRSIPMR